MSKNKTFINSILNIFTKRLMAEAMEEFHNTKDDTKLICLRRDIEILRTGLNNSSKKFIMAFYSYSQKLMELEPTDNKKE